MLDFSPGLLTDISHGLILMNGMSHGAVGETIETPMVFLFFFFIFYCVFLFYIFKKKKKKKKRKLQQYKVNKIV